MNDVVLDKIRNSLLELHRRSISTFEVARAEVVKINASFGVTKTREIVEPDEQLSFMQQFNDMLVRIGCRDLQVF